jgi:hypothetical protein
LGTAFDFDEQRLVDAGKKIDFIIRTPKGNEIGLEVKHYAKGRVHQASKGKVYVLPSNFHIRYPHQFKFPTVLVVVDSRDDAMYYGWVVDSTLQAFRPTELLPFNRDRVKSLVSQVDRAK